MAEKEISNHLVAEARTQFGKGAARKIRAIGKIPAVIYGHGTEPQHVTLPGHEVSLLLRKANQVLELDIAGKEQLALVKDVQKDPVRQIIEHIDLIVVRKGEKVTVDVPVHLEGESAPGTSVNQDATTISLEVEATHIPENVVVSIEGLGEGTHVTAADVTLPKGASLVSDPETLIVGITGEVAQDLGDETEAEADAAEAAEGDAEEAAEEAAAEGDAE
ncbi:50S ribosomal protein L25/general stress protein Ctc [Antiquaquibacter soli]|uniref:Large ribosomal subunit protein bL25 n=1 Tax=Antiquaquibacter soli TaxID=3064523 RepID=A0ABT9BS62_9MICO|nr:50S ribosomal protein L25/general stress protein Ctc [Protaetiibacter sp. WY-16]MDO7883267.1 50S ribosomal protein L25/general stress protein Ctc [Protaetiibacter sp. WY-16]